MTQGFVSNRALGALAALAALLTGCGGSGGDNAKGISISVDKDPFRVTVLRDGEPVVEQDLDGRLRYRLRSNGEVRQLTEVLSSNGDVYEVATDEPGRTATVTVEQTRSGARLSLRLHPETDVQQVYDAFEAGPDDHFLGGGERGGAVDLRGQVLQVKVSYVCTHAPVPYFSSSAGWGLRLATQNVSALAFPGSAGGTGCVFGEQPSCAFQPLERRVEVCVQGARLDEDLYVGTFAQNLRAYYADAGRPLVPPTTQYELIKWRDVVEGPEQILEDVDRLQAAGIPIGWVLLDNPWEACVGDLTFSRDRIPDPAALIRQVRARGVRFMLWISPKLLCGATNHGYPASGVLGRGEERQTIDLRDKAVVTEFRRRLRALVALGVGGVKGDRADEVDLEGVESSLQNRYALLFARAVMAELPDDAAVIVRAATMGSQSVLPGIWPGDQSGDWLGLQTAIRLGQTAAMSGFPSWGSDVGGYVSFDVTADVFARWAQLGAVSPVMEVGGIGPNATPWVLGETAMDALRAAAILHYELFPYFESLLRRGEPVLRPLGFVYPSDPKAWEAELEFLVGPDLLAAPVTGQGTTPSIYLPEGSWVDLHTGAEVEGATVFIRSTPLTELPLYARAGAVIPFNVRTRDSWWGLNELAHPGRAGFLATNGADLDLRGQPRDVQIFVPATARPRTVTLGGRPVRWTWSEGTFPGVVVRLNGPAVRGRILLSGA